MPTGATLRHAVAAIQSVHAQRPITGVTNHTALRILYDLLVAHAPSLGVLVARAAALCESGDASGALEALAELPTQRVENYQPYWVTRASALNSNGQGAEAVMAMNRAVGLTEDESVRAYLRAQAARFAVA